MKKFKIINLFLITVLACSASANKKYDMNDYDKKKVNEYDNYLVKDSDYTTNGITYHKKYKVCMYSIVEHLMVKQQYEIVMQSVGFYYDQKKSKNKYYLGLDIICDEKTVLINQSYSDNGRKMIKEYLPPIMNIVFSCDKIFAENDIEGIVIGLVWKRNGRNESINIWTAKDDISRYYNKRLTFREMVYRSTVTDSQDRIIRLTL